MHLFIYLGYLSNGRRVRHGKVWHRNCSDGCDETRGYYEIHHSSCHGRYVGRIYLIIYNILHLTSISHLRYHRYLRSGCGSSYCWSAL